MQHTFFGTKTGRRKRRRFKSHERRGKERDGTSLGKGMDGSSSEGSYDSEEERREAWKNQQKYRESVKKEVESQWRKLHEYRGRRENLRDMQIEMERMRIEMEWRDAWTFEEDVDEKERQERAARAASALERELERGADGRSGFTKQWQEHEREWKAFTSTSEQPVILDSIPWPPCPFRLLSGMAAVLLGASEESRISIYDAHRKAYKMASLRWHPDKFLHKFGSQLENDEREEILQRVQHISQCINDSWDEIKGRNIS